MSTEPSSDVTGGPGPPADEFWPRFWFYVCQYAEYYFMLLIVVTMMAVLNAIAMLLAPQSTGAFIISLMVFVILGVTAASMGGVLYQCRKIKAPDVEPSQE